MNIENCPICGNPINQLVFQCKDHSVSKEMFDINECKPCSLKITNPKPLPSEIGRYYQTEDYVSHSETKKGIVNKLYHLVKNQNTKGKLKIVNIYALSEKSLLDIGCGAGYFLSICKQNGWKIDGVELSDLARKSAEEKTCQILHPSIESMVETGKKFNVISLWHVLEHLPDLNLALEQFKSILSPGGTIVIAVPNAGSNDAVHYQSDWAAYDVPRHLYHFTQQAMKLLVNKHGMTIKKIIPMKFDSFYVSMLSEQQKGSGKLSALIKGFSNGAQSNMKAVKNGEYSSLIYIVSL